MGQPGGDEVKEEDSDAARQGGEKELPKRQRRKDRAAAVSVAADGSASGADAPVPNFVDGDNKELLPADAYRAKFFITSAREGSVVLPDPVQRFDDAPFGKKIRASLAAAGFAAPSPIQAQGWPIAVAGTDLVAVAKTGSGKTLGFLLPAFRLIGKIADAEAGSSCAKPRAIVLAPTRELASQIEAECKKFQDVARVTSLAVFGGAPKGPQVKGLRDVAPSILVATPGRLQDLMEMNVVRLNKIQYLVLDEADRMLDMGFEPEIAKILETTPSSRQTLLFTATWPKVVQRIASKYLKEDHVHVNVGQTEELAANKAVTQEFHKLGDDEKELKLWRFLADLPDTAKLICFMNTKRRVEQLTKAFWERGYEVAALHGDKAQWERDRDLASFASGKCWILFATDVCARGLDIKGVTHVVNYDMARDVESYVHRIGRTGRAGASGIAITFWNEAYDMECAPALAKIAQEAGQEVPDFLAKAAAKQKQAKSKLWRY